MIIHVDETTTIDTGRDLTAEERHVLQKLFGWKTMVNSVKEFRQRKKSALAAGWNNSGPIRESKAMSLVNKLLEKEIHLRLKEAGEK